ncbi:MAG: hypothetical protein PVG07_15305 [Acidobacteriota bacterium]
MPETYTFELTFTGLCIFTFAGTDKRKPDAVHVLLPETAGHGAEHPHVPQLAFDTHNVEMESVSKPGFRLAPGPDGRLLGCKDLHGVRPLQIEVRKGFELPPLHAVWRPEKVATLPEHPDRSDLSQEEWLDWVMALRRMNPETPCPEDCPPYHGLRSEHGCGTPTMIARVELKGGTLKAGGFPMRWNRDESRWEYRLWTFKEPAKARGDGNPSATHTMAGSVVLSIPGIPVASAVVLRGEGGFQVWLVPRRQPDATYQPLVRASVSNLPPDDDAGEKPEYLRHFREFYRCVDFQGKPPNELRLPHEIGHTITRTSSFCPPTSHTEGG